jgi:hypothetical protein
MPMHLSLPSIEPLFPPGYRLTGNEEGRLLSLLARFPSESGRLIAQEHLTRTQWRILMALIDA